jgi:hypothetical protein|tara:strand:- start:94 stop:537 length:444 start_codon:yes stop_codon:yes gene_type:complete
MAGTLADHRRLRKEQGLYKEDPGQGRFTKTETNYIPFLGNNPSDEKPAIYTGRFKVTDGSIDLEAKRSGGKLSITVECDEKLNRAVFECVERFVEAIFDGTAREIKEADPEDSQIAKLKKHISQVEKELKEEKETVRKIHESLGIKS